MSMLLIVVVSAVILSAAYWTYGPLLVRLLRVNPNATTPAVEMRDDVDYVPANANELLSQHFSAIAAAGPIVGPILAGVMFGWLPALAWILVGSIFVGGVHDFTALMASIRHKARSIAEVVRDHMSGRAFLLFLAFVWLALVYIIVAFTDITAAAFVKNDDLGDGKEVLGAGIATSSLLYLLLPVIMGLLCRYGRLSANWATLVFLPLVGLSIWGGQYLPFDVPAIVRSLNPSLDVAASRQIAHKVWDVALLGYCCVASVVPMWLLLQPRGQLGGYFLYIALLGGALGLIVGGDAVAYPAFRGWSDPASGATLVPMLFITIACGACSGFHALIASGTTSKQLRTEKHARVIGYGAMLLEGMVAIVSLCCVMRLTADSPLLKNPKPDSIYAMGIGNFLEALGVDGKLGVAFALMAFTTFVYDTLDVCTRLGRYIIQELTGWHGARGRWLGTLLTAGVPLFFVMQTLRNEKGEIVALWRVFWPLFGASNQLLAALSLLGVTVWLWRTRGEWWVWVVTGLPTLVMYVMSTWALGTMIVGGQRKIATQLANGQPVQTVSYIVLAVSSLLVVLAILMLVEAFLAIFRPRRSDTTAIPVKTVPVGA